MKINTIKMNVRRYIEIAFGGFFVGGGRCKEHYEEVYFCEKSGEIKTMGSTATIKRERDRNFGKKDHCALLEYQQNKRKQAEKESAPVCSSQL